KSGTTSLHNYLNQHPDVFMCTPKEPHFLINNEIGKDRIPIGICSENDYLNLFLRGKEKRYRGESSVMYLMFPEVVIPKINQQFGEDCKIIIMLRNPIERAYSGFQHVKRYNVKEDCTDFKSAWSISEERYFSKPEMTPASRYKELGLYYKQVKSYLDGMKNVHIIIYDDYQNDFKNEMIKVFDFLGINNINIDSDKRHMEGGWQWEDEKMKRLLTKKNAIKSVLKVLIPFKGLRKSIRQKIQNRNTLVVPKISDEDKNMLQRFYKKDVKKLSDLLEKNLNYWTE
ncbi:MAG TPA: sulfotransferase domain-containing protein, partial [Flavobacteriales bacterium]|nr:sulfotransferase domain-containing protein [Flavobacteriales bacterium]